MSFLANISLFVVIILIFHAHGKLKKEQSRMNANNMANNWAKSKQLLDVSMGLLQSIVVVMIFAGIAMAVHILTIVI